MSATRGKLVGMLLLGLVAACGDSNGPDDDPNNTAPTANFTWECTDLACTFTNLSSDADGTIADSACPRIHVDSSIADTATSTASRKASTGRTFIA